jgi:hypothetical protein
VSELPPDPEPLEPLLLPEPLLPPELPPLPELLLDPASELIAIPPSLEAPPSGLLDGAPLLPHPQAADPSTDAANAHVQASREAMRND